MDEDLISKKELLDLTGISYGQLYRWKRKRLIPEDWFIRRSTFTGQETFFPRDKILARIELIRNMKEDLSLDEIAHRVSPVPDVTVPLDDLAKHHIVTQTTCEWCRAASGQATLVFAEVLALSVIDELIRGGHIAWGEADIVWRALREHYARFAERPTTLVFVRKLGVSTCAMVAARQEGGADIEFEGEAHVVARMDLTAAAEALKLRLTEAGERG
ncbi:MAG: YhbD family protein [Alicyclobacillaceae bacterium]|nr:YhbD family protein [Alicyclobacillaceae bacterium]